MGVADQYIGKELGKPEQIKKQSEEEGALTGEPGGLQPPCRNMLVAFKVVQGPVRVKRTGEFLLKKDKKISEIGRRNSNLHPAEIIKRPPWIVHAPLSKCGTG